MAVLGIDISHHQATTPSLEGLGFVFVRATYGLMPDRRTATHAAAVRAAGLVLGAYHFGRAGDPAAQAEAFLARVGDADLFALDLEADGRGPSMSQAEARVFLRAVQVSGRSCGLYHSDSGYPSLGQDWNWVARWSPNPPSRRWAFWQYRGAPLDLDRFAGSDADLALFAGRARPVVYRLTISQRTPVHASPGGARVGTVSRATYQARRSMVEARWWYQIVGPARSRLVGRWLPAEPWMGLDPVGS